MPFCSLGEDPHDRRHASLLRDEPLLQALQMELEMSAELSVCGRQDDTKLIRRHLLTPSHDLRSGLGARQIWQGRLVSQADR